MNYIKMKEVIFEKDIFLIKEVFKDKDKVTIKFKDDSFIDIDNLEVYNVLKKVIQ